MEERNLSNQFHEAFDVEPRPGSYDRMRIALTATPVVLRRRSGFRLRFNNKMGFRVAAGLAVAAIVIVALVAYLSLHHTTVGTTVPAATGQDIKPYQTLIARDYATTVASTSNHCNTIQDNGCNAAYQKVRANLVAWLNDMSGVTPPSRFAPIDAMLRHHLASAVVEGDAAMAAQRAGNAALFDTAMTAHFNERGLIDSVAGAVANTRTATSAVYKSQLQFQFGLFVTCTPCGRWASTAPVSCSGTEMYICVTDITAVDAQIYSLEAVLVQNAAPASIGAQDGNLQTDLVNADSALIAMIKAGLTGDDAGFNAARGSLQVSMSAVNLDVTAISNS